MSEKRTGGQARTRRAGDGDSMSNDVIITNEADHDLPGFVLAGLSIRTSNTTRPSFS